MARALSPARPGPAARPGQGTGHAVALHGVTKVYRPGCSTVTALRGVHLAFPAGIGAGSDRPPAGTLASGIPDRFL